MDWSEPNPIPKCDTSPNVGLWPMIPQNAAGMRMEPPWSPPNEMSTSPAATAAPESAVGCSFDAALPRPRVEPVFFRRRPVSGFPRGGDHRRLRLLQPRLHEGI